MIFRQPPWKHLKTTVTYQHPAPRCSRVKRHVRSAAWKWSERSPPLAAGGSCNTTSCELWSNIRPWMAQEFQRWLIKNSFAESMMGTSTTWEIDWSGLRPFFLGRLCRSLCRIYSSCSWCCCMLLPGVTVLRYVVWYVCVTCVLSFWSYIYLGPPFHVRFFDKRRCEKTRGNLIKTTMQNLCHLYLEHVSLRGSRYQYYLWEVEVPLEASPSKDSVFSFF
jgi:hypothetical protein